MLDRFVDGLASRCPRKGKESKRVNHPAAVTPCQIRKNKFKVEVVPLLPWATRQIVSAAPSCAENFCFSSCFGGLLRVWVRSL